MDWLHDMIFQPQSTVQKIVVMVFAMALFVAVVGLIMWLIGRPGVPTWLVFLGFAGPVLAAVSLGLVYPFIRTVLDSFHQFNSVGQAVGWNGLDNYTSYFSGQGNRRMLINTVLWLFLVPMLATGLGLVYATLVDRVRGEKFAKALVFLPMAISMVAAGIAWRYIYYQPAPKGESQIGLLNFLWSLVGGEPTNWLIKYPQGTFAMIIVMVWIQTGFAMTVLSAAIKAVPDDIVEAARIDGASGWKLFTKITVPSIRTTLVVVVTTVAIAALKSFDVVFTMGSNLPSNDILASAFYNAQSTLNYGKAGAAAVLIFILVIPVIAYNVLQMRKADSYR